MKNQETWKKRGIIRQILKDHFHGFMEMHGHHLPEDLRSSITETVNKAIRCGTRDMNVRDVQKARRIRCIYALPAKAAFVRGAGKNTRMNGQKSSRNVS